MRIDVDKFYRGQMPPTPAPPKREPAANVEPASIMVMVWAAEEAGARRGFRIGWWVGLLFGVGLGFVLGVWVTFRHILT